MVQLVKNLPAMLETWVRSLDWEDPLEKGKATHSSVLKLDKAYVTSLLFLSRFINKYIPNISFFCIL